MDRLIDFDCWDYFECTIDGKRMGVVVNHFRDEGDPQVNVYVVPEDKVDKGDWHSDMIDITDGKCSPCVEVFSIESIERSR